MNQAPSQEHIHSYERPSVRPGTEASAPPPPTLSRPRAQLRLPGASGWREMGRTGLGPRDLSPKPFSSCVHSFPTSGLHDFSSRTCHPAGRYHSGDGTLESRRQSVRPDSSAPGPGSSWRGGAPTSGVDQHGPPRASEGNTQTRLDNRQKCALSSSFPSVWVHYLRNRDGNLIFDVGLRFTSLLLYKNSTLCQGW